MQAVMKNGLTVEIDTTYLFNDQYNTYPGIGEKNGKRIFDGEILRIIDDVREGFGKCKYCGTIVKRGEEEKHFAEKEAKTCNGCFWYQNKLLTSDHSKPIETVRTDVDGRKTVQTVRVTTDVYEKYCAYKEKHGDCTNNECRNYGIEWFTEKNTFFLGHQNGFEMISPDLLWNAGFEIPERDFEDPKYFRKIGSYTLKASCEYDKNRKRIGVKGFWIENTRVRHLIRYENGCFYVNDFKFGWKRHAHLERIPCDVERMVIKILMEVEKNGSAA